MTRCFTIMLLFAALASAQEKDRDAGSVHGLVISSAGEPVGKANVLLQGPGGYFADVTSPDGTFAFADVPAGRYVSVVRRPGYAPHSTPAVVSAGKASEELVHRLQALAVLSGRVIDEYGEPMAKIAVFALRVTWSQPGTSLSRTADQAASATTDDRGEFRLANLNDGRYLLLADEPAATYASIERQQERRGVSASVLPVPTYYPTALDPQSAVPIAARGGQEASGLVIRMRHSQRYSIRGTVRTRIGNQGVAGTVLAYNRAHPQSIRTHATMPSAGDGFALVGLPPGEYHLEGVANLPGSPTVSGGVDVTIRDRDVEDIEILLDGHQDVEGRISMEDGSAVTANRISVFREDNTRDQRKANVWEDGSFRITNIPVGRYALDVTINNREFHIQSVRRGGSELPNAPLDLAVGGSGPLEIVIGKNTARLKPSPVHDFEPGTQPMMILWPDEPKRMETMQGVRWIDNQAVEQAPPGNYYFAVFDSLDYVHFRYGFLARLNDFATRVTLKPGETITAEPAYISPAIIGNVEAQMN